MKVTIEDISFMLEHKGIVYYVEVLHNYYPEQSDMYRCFIDGDQVNGEYTYRVAWDFDSSGGTFDDYPDDEVSKIVMEVLFNEKNPMIREF